MKKLRFIFALLFIAIAMQALADLGPLIPRDILFGNPERATPRISPDAKRLAWLAPDKKNVLQVWVRTIGQNDDKIVTADKKRGIRQYNWAGDSKTLLYLQDNDGDENFHVYGVDLASGVVRDYTPIQGSRAQIEALEPEIPDQMLVSINARDKHLFDIYRVTLSTGALVLDTPNPGDVAGWVADKNLNVRAAQVVTPEGGTEIRIRDNPQSAWRTWLKASPEENVGVDDISADGKAAIVETSIGSDTARVVLKDFATGNERLIASSPDVDAGVVMVNPKTHSVEAVSLA